MSLWAGTRLYASPGGKASEEDYPWCPCKAVRTF
jgi:hypothetical protein